MKYEREWLLLRGKLDWLAILAATWVKLGELGERKMYRVVDPSPEDN